ncbi:hypothetical protein GA0115242_104918, partial [Streptomyces sp. SolWspMP-5a-2]
MTHGHTTGHPSHGTPRQYPTGSGPDAVPVAGAGAWTAGGAGPG